MLVEMGRSPCSETKNNSLKRGPWTPEEDQKLINYIHNNGYGNWRTLPKNAGLQRCGKSCRLRWTNYLRPDIKRGRFSVEEEETIIQLHAVLGNKWSAIASRLPGRTDNEIKNYWNTHIRKRLLRTGIDPVTHSLRLDLLDLSSIFNLSLHTNPSHIDFSMLFGPQPLINPSQYDLNFDCVQNLHSNDTQNQFTPLPQLVAQTTSTPTPCIPFSSSCDQAQISDMGVDFDCLYPINDGFGVQSLEDQTQGFRHTLDTWQMFGNTTNTIAGRRISSRLDADVINQDDYGASCNGFLNSESSTFSNQISGFSSVLSSSSPVTWNSNLNSDSTCITSENGGEMLQQLIQV